MESKRGTKLSLGLARLWRALFATARNYIVVVKARSEGAGLAALRTMWRGTALNWPGLAVLCFSVLATAYLGLQGQGFPILRAEVWEGEMVAVPSPALTLSLLVISFGWAYLLVGAATSGLGVYVLAAAYAAYYGLYAGLSLGNTPWFGLIPLWLLVLGGWVASSKPNRWRLPLLVVLSSMAALLTRNSLGLKAILPGTWGMLVLGGFYFALVANPWAMRMMKERPFRPSVAFGVSLLVFVCFYALTLVQSPTEEVLENAFLAFHGLLGLVGLAWYWIGLDLFNSAQDLAEWLEVTLKALVPRRILRTTIFSLWIVGSVLSYLIVHGPPLRLTQFLLNYSFGEALLRTVLSLDPSVVLISALEVDLYVTVALALLATVLWRLRRLSLEGLMRLFGLSLVGFFVLWGYFGLFYSFASADLQAALGFWPLLLFTGGMFLAILQVGSGLISRAGHRSSLFLGFLLLLGGISLLELSAAYPLFEQELSLNTLVSVLYLGLPYLLYTFLYRQRQFTLVSSRHLLHLFGLGMLSAIPSLLLERILLAPLLWLVILLATVWRWGRWDERADGVVYAVSLALGFGVFYTHPIWIPIPAFTGFLGRFLELQARYGEAVIWPWEAQWWWIFLGTVGAAAILGFLLSKARLARGRSRILWLVLAPFLSLAFLAACEFALVGPH